jgi:Transposase DDE domain
VAVDAKNKLIVEQAVTNQVVDLGLLRQTAERAREVLGVEAIDVVADRGYFKIEDIEACEKTGCVPHVPKPQRGSSVRKGLSRRLRLPGREVADADPPRPDARSRKDRLRQPESLAAPVPCARDARNDARSVFRLENEDILDRMAERLKARPAILDRRREVVEHPFGSIKQWMYQGAFLMRGLANVRADSA